MKSEAHSLREELEYVVKRTGRTESEVMVAALETGMRDLYHEELIAAYLAGELSREALIQKVGLDRVEDVDYTAECIRKDVEWGLRGGRSRG